MYNFGGNTGITPEEIKHRREIARAMMGQAAAPQNVGEGIYSAANSIAGGLMQRHANRKEQEGQDAATEIFNSVFNSPRPSVSTSGGVGRVSSAMTQRDRRNAAMAANGGPTRAAADALSSERELLARTLQAEAGGEGLGGMIAAGSVINNRVADGGYGDGLSGVIMKPGQFSAWNSVTGYAGGEGGLDMQNMQPSEQAYRAADMLLSGQYEDPTGGATHYYNANVADPNWGMRAGGDWTQIGNHWFGNADAGRSGPARVSQGSVSTSGGGQYSAPRYNGPSVQQIQQVLANPFLSDQQRQQAKFALQRAMDAEDPLRQMQLEQAQIELQNARNPQRETQYVDGVGLIDKQSGQVIQSYETAPDPGYEMLSREEAASLGLPEGNYQRSPDGKIMTIGGGGQTINVNTGNQNPVPGLSKLGEGMTYLYDKDGNIRLDEQGRPMSAPVAGTDSDIERQQNAEAEERKQAQQKLMLGTTLSSINLNIDEIENGGLPVTGAFGDFRRTNIGRALTGNAAVDFGNRTNQVTDSAAFSEIQRMRDNSPTGGAVGQLTDGERQAIGNAVTALNNSTSAEEYLRAAKAYRKLALDLAYGEGQWSLAEDGSVSAGGQEPTQAASEPQQQGDSDIPPPPEGYTQERWESLWESMEEADRRLFR
ncbi:Spore cortex-lytic enzyme precursor [Roseivivax jejudonensis]|uniref:Spore cortex-lytic enzyme n=1 Tax=Roseivivax jejudonensis TaxID=1529041 RepID=A0A1X7AB24_9RHOB|nr:cell wall hydrolase [Roseivivax jejudonensis]SLN74734.1 Spore cortex-lytic enzyme precursor [Roseivivax jejudonensis]